MQSTDDIPSEEETVYHLISRQKFRVFILKIAAEKPGDVVYIQWRKETSF